MTTTITCPIPDNITPLSPNGFMFNISKLSSISFFCQSVMIPGVTLGAPEFVNPFSTQPIPGEILTYDQLNVQFLVDSNMDNYRAIYNWIVALGFPQSYDQYITFKGDDNVNYSELAKNYSDATLHILAGNNQISQSIQFFDMFPIGIDSLQFASTNTDVQYLVGNATFRYGYYKFL
jgi:hypothetical protein